jgi:ectoine hydroxylase-related dioxygenase (phytanoyl-CoA dioxygenase family)
MRTGLESEQIEYYQENGFLIYRNLLSSYEVEELKKAVLDAISTMGRNRITGQDVHLKDSDGYFDRVYTQRLNLWAISEKVKSYLQDPKLGKMLCELEGIDGIRVWHDQALIKEPFGNPTNLHLDNPYWSFYSRNSITIWIALEDATPENGCLCFLPKSNRLASIDNVGPTQEFGELLNLYPLMRDIEPVVAAMKAGDCSFHNGLTAHGAGVNMTKQRRIALTCAYMPEGMTFNGNRNVLPTDYFNSLEIGDVLDWEEFNPLVYPKQI